MAENPKNRAKALEELIKAMKWLQKNNKQNNLMELVFKGNSTFKFKGTDNEMNFLVEILEEAKGLKAQYEKERMMHLETINQVSASPIERELLRDRARLYALAHDTHLVQLKKEISVLQSNLANEVHHNEKLIRELNEQNTRVEQELNEKIGKIEAEHQEVLAIYQTQLDETLAQIKTLEGRQNSGADCAQHCNRLDELWQENQALGDQLDTFRSMYLAEKAKANPPPKPKTPPKPEPTLQKMEELAKKNRELSGQLDTFVAQLVDKDEALMAAENTKKLMEKGLAAAMKQIRELQLANEDGWKVVDVEDVDEEVYTLCSDEFPAPNQSK